jgi:hypothetical protein
VPSVSVGTTAIPRPAPTRLFRGSAHPNSRRPWSKNGGQYAVADENGVVSQPPRPLRGDCGRYEAQAFHSAWREYDRVVQSPTTHDRLNNLRSSPVPGRHSGRRLQLLPREGCVRLVVAEQMVQSTVHRQAERHPDRHRQRMAVQRPSDPDRLSTVRMGRCLGQSTSFIRGARVSTKPAFS